MKVTKKIKTVRPGGCGPRRRKENDGDQTRSFTRRIRFSLPLFTFRMIPLPWRSLSVVLTDDLGTPTSRTISDWNCSPLCASTSWMIFSSRLSRSAFEGVRPGSSVSSGYRIRRGSQASSCGIKRALRWR